MQSLDGHHHFICVQMLTKKLNFAPNLRNMALEMKKLYCLSVVSSLQHFGFLPAQNWVPRSLKTLGKTLVKAKKKLLVTNDEDPYMVHLNVFSDAIPIVELMEFPKVS